MTSFIIFTFPHRGTVRKKYTNSLVRSPGSTVVFRPSACKIGTPIWAGVRNMFIFILARCPKPLATGPGAAASTSTPKGCSYDGQCFRQGL